MNISLPEEFIKRVTTQEQIDLTAMQRSLSVPGSVSIRINSKIPSENRLKELKRVPWSETGYYLPGRPLFAADPLWHAGCYYVQESSSMFLEQLFIRARGREQGLRILDLCAAPGGKSTHISHLADDSSLIVANETIAARCNVLVENINRWGATNVVVTRNDPSAFSSLPGWFDIIVADVPCSGEGMFRNRAVREEWSEANCRLCADRQKRITGSVWPALKPGGYFIYSTCTFNPSENEEMISWLIDQFGAEVVETDISPFQGVREVSVGNKVMGYGLYPWLVEGEGFFISLLRKPGEPGSNSKQRSGKRLQMAGGEKLRIARALSSFSEERIVDNSGMIMALHTGRDESAILAEKLRVIKPGTALFTLKGKDINPSHQLITSLKTRRDYLPEAELDYRQAVAYLKREAVDLPGNLVGKWFMVTYRGIPLGVAKDAGGRANNYYPREWALRMAPPGESPVII